MKTKSATTAVYVRAARSLIKAAQRAKLLQAALARAEYHHENASSHFRAAKEAAFANEPDMAYINATVGDNRWRQAVQRKVKL